MEYYEACKAKFNLEKAKISLQSPKQILLKPNLTLDKALDKTLVKCFTLDKTILS